MRSRAVVTRHILTMDDLDDHAVRSILDDAARLYDGAEVRTRPFVAALLFLTSSLRTRSGYAIAAARLGGHPLDVHELRFGAGMSGAESWEDTLRTISGTVDVVVARTPFPADRALISEHCIVPFVNGGDGPNEHPTQTLIDLATVEAERGPVDDQHIVISGDLRMRSVRSLLRWFNRHPPRSLTLVAPEGRADPGVEIAPALRAVTRRASLRDALPGADVLYLPGLPQGDGTLLLDDAARQPFALGSEALETLATDAVVLSPMPVIDEVAAAARRDPRVRLFATSDRGVAVRMALLRHLLDPG